MKVGILPAPNAGIRTMERAGQLGRLTRHFAAYQDAGHELAYFTCLPDDPAWICPVVRPPAFSASNGTRRAILRPLRESRAFRRPDVFRCMSLSASLSGMTARLVWRTPFVVSHGAKYEEIARLHGRPAWKWTALRHLAFRLASAVIVPNALQAAELRSRFPSTTIVHVPNWIDTAAFHPVEPYTGPPTVLYVGRLVVEKNLERLARVCRRRGWRLICVGEGPLRADLTALGAACPGAVPWERLPEYHVRAHVFCLPSYTEGHPKALLEAMASGLPCAVSTGVDGMTGPHAAFPPENERAMGEAIAYLMAHGPDFVNGTREAALAYDIATVLPQEIRLVESVR